MRTLVAVQTHLRTPDEVTLFKLWQLMRHRSDDAHDWLVVDNASPLAPELYPHGWDVRLIVNDDHVPQTRARRSIVRFCNKLGHPFHDGVRQASGSDRAFCKMLEIAIASDYQRFAYIEMDVLFALSVQSIFDRMTKPCACGPLVDHGKFPEMGLFFADVEHLWRIDFITKYNWRGKCEPEGELRAWQILGDALELLPLKGARDGGYTLPAQLASKYPDGIDYLTHAHMGTYAEFLRLNNLPELANLL
jgi:hypothetical protein